MSKKVLRDVGVHCNIFALATFKILIHMIKSLGKLTLITILAAAAVGMPVQAGPPVAPDAKTTAPTAPDAKPRAIPFRGKIGAVDKVAKTFTLEEKTKRVLQITSETKFLRDGKPATFDAYAVGDAITGQYLKGDDGKLTAKSILFGAKPGTKGDTTPSSSAPAAKKE